MRVLQISCGYVFSKIYYNLFHAIGNQGIDQIVYSPIRKDEEIYIERYDTKKYQIIYSTVLQKWHRLFYHLKQRILLNDILKHIDIEKCDIIHAHTLLTDGGLAYKLNKKYGIPYVVAVRNTDINGFLEKMPHTWCKARQILLGAKRIYFISQGLMNIFEQQKSVQSIMPLIKEKMFLEPNGVDDEFLDNINKKRSNNHKIIYVGEFSPNKNVVRLIEATKIVRQEKGLNDTSITIVGGSRDYDGSVQKSIEDYSSFVSFLGPVYDVKKLINLYRNHSMFAMPSIHETFGLVYIEALSQGLPVLYTKGQGVDGVLPHTAGCGVNPLSIDEIAHVLKSILTDKSYNNKDVDFEKYRWSNIAIDYLTDYSRIIS